MPEVKANELIENYTFYLSLADIAQLDICKEGDLPSDKLVEVLYENGMDTRRNYQFVYDTHRTLTGQIVTCERIVGYMRKDPEWVEKMGTNIHEIKYQLLTEKKYRGCEDMFKETF
jgi:hypothetical protein